MTCRGPSGPTVKTFKCGCPVAAPVVIDSFEKFERRCPVAASAALRFQTFRCKCPVSAPVAPVVIQLKTFEHGCPVAVPAALRFKTFNCGCPVAAPVVKKYKNIRACSSSYGHTVQNMPVALSVSIS